MNPQRHTLYTHYSDEVARAATTITIEDDTTPSLSGGDDYGPATLVDDNPAKVAKINATSGAWVFAYAVKQPIRFAALIHTSADASGGAAHVWLEGNDTADFSTPAFAAEFDIPSWLGAGTGRWPQNAFLVLDDQPGFSALGFLFWRLRFVAQSSLIRVGQVRFHPTYYAFDPDLKWGLTVRADKPVIENRSAFGVSTIYSRATALWGQEANIMLVDEMRTALEAHWYDVEGRTRPWVIVPSGPVRDDRCYLVRYLTTEEDVRWTVPDLTEQRLQFQEVGRGLRP